MKKSGFTIALLATLLALPVYGASVNSSIKVEKGAESDGAKTVNGSVTIGEDATVTGVVKTVNGSVRVDDGARIETASTVNGRVTIGDKVQAEDLKTVNGAIRVGSAVTVDGSIKTTNGKITVEEGTTVAGDVSNSNGRIELGGTSVGGDIATVSGDIELYQGTVVNGDLIVRKPSNWGWGKKDEPRVVIGPGVEIVGDIILERKVELFVSESAKIGGVEGEMSMDDAERFSGDKP